MVEQWNKDGERVEHLMVEESNISCWNSGTSDDGTVEQSWWNSRTSDGQTVDHVTVEQWKIRWWNSRRVDGGTVEQRWWNSGTDTVKQ